MGVIKNFVKWFLYITIGIMIVAGILFSASGEGVLPKNTIWYILLSGLLTAMVTVLFHLENINTWRQFVIRAIFHYLSLSAVMIVLGNLFGWMEPDLSGIIMMLGSVGAVYLITFTVHYIMDLKQAEKINEKLKEKYGSKN